MDGWWVAAVLEGRIHPHTDHHRQRGCPGRGGTSAARASTPRPTAIPKPHRLSPLVADGGLRILQSCQVAHQAVNRQFPGTSSDLCTRLHLRPAVSASRTIYDRLAGAGAPTPRPRPAGAPRTRPGRAATTVLPASTRPGTVTTSSDPFSVHPSIAEIARLGTVLGSYTGSYRRAEVGGPARETLEPRPAPSELAGSAPSCTSMHLVPTEAGSSSLRHERKPGTAGRGRWRAGKPGSIYARYCSPVPVRSGGSHVESEKPRPATTR
jgi:hypothetical protein